MGRTDGRTNERTDGHKDHYINASFYEFSHQAITKGLWLHRVTILSIIRFEFLDCVKFILENDGNVAPNFTGFSFFESNSVGLVVYLRHAKFWRICRISYFVVTYRSFLKQYHTPPPSNFRSVESLLFVGNRCL